MTSIHLSSSPHTWKTLISSSRHAHSWLEPEVEHRRYYPRKFKVNQSILNFQAVKAIRSFNSHSLVKSYFSFRRLIKRLENLRVTFSDRTDLGDVTVPSFESTVFFRTPQSQKVQNGASNYLYFFKTHDSALMVIHSGWEGNCFLAQCAAERRARFSE